MNHFAEVIQFNEAARAALPQRPTQLTVDQTKLCLRLIVEESFEAVEACLDNNSMAYLLLRAHKDAMQKLIAEDLNTTNMAQDNVALLDGLCDTIVVIMGMAAFAGLPLNEGMGEVNRSNLAKINPATGKCIKDAGGKIQKPDGWKKPDLEAVIAFAEIHGNRGDVVFERAKPISPELEARLDACGKFPENLAGVQSAVS